MLTKNKLVQTKLVFCNLTYERHYEKYTKTIMLLRFKFLIFSVYVQNTDWYFERKVVISNIDNDYHCGVYCYNYCSIIIIIIRTNSQTAQASPCNGDNGKEYCTGYHAGAIQAHKDFKTGDDLDVSNIDVLVVQSTALDMGEDITMNKTS